MRHPTDRIIHTTAFVTPAMGHWLEREIARTSYEEKINDEVIHVFLVFKKKKLEALFAIIAVIVTLICNSLYSANR